MPKTPIGPLKKYQSLFSSDQLKKIKQTQAAETKTQQLIPIGLPKIPKKKKPHTREKIAKAFTINPDLNVIAQLRSGPRKDIRKIDLSKFRKSLKKEQKK